MSAIDRIPDWMASYIPPAAPPAGQLDLQTWTQNFRDVYQVAEALCKTPFVPKEMIGRQADVAAAIMKGRELGLNPFDALGSIYIVHGRVGYYAEFMRRRIIQAGHTLRIIENTDNRAIIEGTRKEGGEAQRASFTAEQARKAGIDLGKYPADKLVARATSRLCRQVFPDVLSGSLIAEDLIDGLIPVDDSGAPAAVPTPPLSRRRATKPPKAAATQPPPPAPTKSDDDDVAELLGDQPPTEQPATDTPDEEPDPWQPVPVSPDQIPLLPDDDVYVGQDDDDDQGEPLITAAQLKKLSILLRENGFTERQARHDYVTACIGRVIATAKQLTVTEASTVIDTLESDRNTND